MFADGAGPWQMFFFLNSAEESSSDIEAYFLFSKHFSQRHLNNKTFISKTSWRPLLSSSCSIFFWSHKRAKFKQFLVCTDTTLCGSPCVKHCLLFLLFLSAKLFECWRPGWEQDSEQHASHPQTHKHRPQTFCYQISLLKHRKKLSHCWQFNPRQIK